MIALFHNDKSTCSQKVRLCLAELSLPWEDRHVDLSRQENLTPAYLAINPNGVVPAIVHEEVPIIESTVICEYLAEVFPDEQELMPADAVGRARMRAWLRYIDEVPSMAVRVPTFHRRLRSRFAGMSQEEYADFVARNPLRRDFFERMSKDGFAERDYASAIKQLQQTIERLAVAVGEGGWICNGRYGLADICLAPVFQRLDDLGMADLWAGAPAVQDWYARLQQRPSYGEAFYLGSRLDDPPKPR